MFDIFETLQLDLDCLMPSDARTELQTDLDLAKAIIEGLSARIAEAATFDEALAIGTRKARIKFTEAVCAAWALPPKPATH